MLTSRSAAERRVTSAPPIRIWPSLAISSPAIRRSVVVLPQPDGPSSVTSCAGLDGEATRRRRRVTVP